MTVCAASETLVTGGPWWIAYTE